MSAEADKIEKLLRDNAVLLVVGNVDHFAAGVSLDSLDPKKKYLLAVVEVK